MHFLSESEKSYGEEVTIPTGYDLICTGCTNDPIIVTFKKSQIHTFWFRANSEKHSGADWIKLPVHLFAKKHRPKQIVNSLQCVL